MGFVAQGQEGVQVRLGRDAHRAAGAGDEPHPLRQQGFQAEAGRGHGVGAADLHDGGRGLRPGCPQAPDDFLHQVLVPEFVNKLHRPGSAAGRGFPRHAPGPPGRWPARRESGRSPPGPTSGSRSRRTCRETPSTSATPAGAVDLNEAHGDGKAHKLTPLIQAM